MPKKDMIVMRGKVVEALPEAKFRVEVEGGHLILCQVNGKMRKNNITVLCHDTVDIEVTPYDLKKGRIIFRHKN